MACKVAENVPLAKLRAALGVGATCHSFRPSCLNGFARIASDTATLAAPGAVLGYCQALFSRHQTPAEHTQHVIQALGAINAPWKLSHELFWGYHGDIDPQTFLDDAMRPLLGVGRVPILITGLDPATDNELPAILRARPPIAAGETMLLRVVLQSEASIVAIARVMRDLLSAASAHSTMPLWWPLLQGSFTNDMWMKAAEIFGEIWPYTCIALNPFSAMDALDVIASQVCVGQVVIGDASGFADDGCITLPAGMKVTGAAPGATYSLPEYIRGLAQLPAIPTLILLGPSLPEWDGQQNTARVARAIQSLRTACDELWSDLPVQRRSYLWSLAA